MMSRKRSVALAILLVAVSAALIYYFLFIRLIVVPTGAMKNTILPGDRMAVHLLSKEIKRGDLIIFRFPKEPSTKFLMRVVGLPGEAIQLRNKRIYINGNELQENRQLVKSQYPDDPEPLKVVSSEGSGDYGACYYQEEASAGFGDVGEFGVSEPFQIPDDSYYVMGDNRDNSLDSRFWGPVQRELIVGKPVLRYWSSDPSGGGVRWGRCFSRIK